jgi:hypothetical protein
MVVPCCEALADLNQRFEMTGHHWKPTTQPAEPAYSSALLRSLDLSEWTPIASRSRRRPPVKRTKPAQPVPRYEWRLIEDAPLTLKEVQAAREAGVLLSALRFETEVETLLIKFSAGAVEAMKS